MSSWSDTGDARVEADESSDREEDEAVEVLVTTVCSGNGTRFAITRAEPCLGHYNDQVESIVQCFIDLMRNEDLRKMAVSAIPKIISNGAFAVLSSFHFSHRIRACCTIIRALYARIIATPS